MTTTASPRMHRDRLHREVATRLREHDVRYTRGRQTVVTALANADGPLSAAELHDELGDDVPLSSLYRTLTVLESAEVAVPHFGARGVTRYELAEWLAGHHHHLVCTDCGSVEDVDIPSGVEERVEVIVRAIADPAGFRPTGHELEISGLCRRCA
ncbi:MAG: Fur family transcriptional regulator [Acidimicrobiia bacterium]